MRSFIYLFYYVAEFGIGIFIYASEYFSSWLDVLLFYFILMVDLDGLVRWIQNMK